MLGGLRRQGFQTVASPQLAFNVDETGEDLGSSDIDAPAQAVDQSKAPAMVAVMNDARAPPIMARTPILASFGRRLGTRAPRPPI